MKPKQKEPQKDNNTTTSDTVNSDDTTSIMDYGVSPSHHNNIIGKYANCPLQSVNHPDHAFVGLLHSDDITELPEYIQDQPSTASDDTEPTQNISISSTSQHTEDLDYESPRAQIDSGAKATVTNALSLLWDVQQFTDEYPSPVKMYGATNKNLLITPTSVGKL